jgi:hypothetical protein
VGRRESDVGVADMVRPSSHVKRLCSNVLSYEWPPFHDYIGSSGIGVLQEGL